MKIPFACSLLLLGGLFFAASKPENAKIAVKPILTNFVIFDSAWSKSSNGISIALGRKKIDSDPGTLETLYIYVRNEANATREYVSPLFLGYVSKYWRISIKDSQGNDITPEMALVQGIEDVQTIAAGGVHVYEMVLPHIGEKVQKQLVTVRYIDDQGKPGGQVVTIEASEPANAAGAK